ncbi:MAG: glycosyltransferase family 2 protein [Acidimicrobiia bacterium]|nr:glycosyltransferase family 2 protein [Acidimicrobiia bacterium]
MTPLSVAIVNYRSGELLPACLDALSRHSGSIRFEVLLVNNDREADLASLRWAAGPEVRTIQSASNVGFGAAANLACQEARGEFLLLLNPDVLVGAGAVESLLESMRLHPEAAIGLPQLRNPDGSLQYSCRRFYTWQTLWMRRGPWRRRWAAHPTVRQHLMQGWDHASLAEVDWGLGAAMLIRRSALAGAELFDKRFFLYFEDVDLCLRLRRAGWKVIYVPQAIMTHEHRRESSRAGALLAKWHHLSSLLKFLWKHRFRLQA